MNLATLASRLATLALALATLSMSGCAQKELPSIDTSRASTHIDNAQSQLSDIDGKAVSILKLLRQR